MDGEVLTPRPPFSSVPFAFQAGSSMAVGTVPAAEIATTTDVTLLQVQIAQLQQQIQGLLCGNGELDDGEECDDGNNVGGDGCSSICTVEQIAPPDATFNDPLDIPLDDSASVTDFVSSPVGDAEDKARYDVTGMNPNPALSGGQAHVVITVSCFGTHVEDVGIFTGGQTFSCGETIVDRDVTADSASGTVTITAVGVAGTYVQWVLSGTATRTN